MNNSFLSRWRMAAWPSCCMLLLLALITFARPLKAQVTTSTIVGYVYDPSGAVIAKAQITVADPNHDVLRKTTTDSAGAYSVSGLAPAIYKLTASAPGFGDVTQEGVTLEVNAELRRDFHLAIAGVNKTIEVTAVVPPVQTESAELGKVIDRAQIETVPLNRLDFLQLAMLSPGVAPPVQGSELSSYGAFAMHANGGREEYNDFLLDGVDNNDPYVGRYGVDPPIDSIQEFKVATNSYSAEYGRSAAGQVNIITRQGTNNLHGSVYEYLRNRVFDARNYFDPAQTPELNRNQFGFDFGGPVVPRRKTYFFASTDFYTDREGLSQLVTVPTMAERGGDLSALGVPITNPLTGQVFNGGMIPSTMISPIAKDILNMFPMATLPGLTNNYLATPVQSENDAQGSYRVDHHFTESDDLMARYSFGHVNLFEPWEGSSNGAASTNLAPGFGDYVRDFTQNGMVQYRRVLSPRMINSLSFSYGRFSRDLLSQNYNVNVGALWNVDWLNIPASAYGFPTISVAGLSGVGDNYSQPIYRHTNTFQVADGLSIEHGSHIFTIGGEVREEQLNSILDLFTRGELQFSGAISGSGLSDLLLGYPSLTIQSTSNNPIALRSTAYDAYFQDSWRVTHSFTLNLGLRYEFNTPATDPTNGMSTFSLATGQIEQVGANGTSRSGYHADVDNFAPRVGFAWNPGKSFVVRAGYGVYYDSGILTVNSSLFFNPPEFVLPVFFPSASLLTLQNPFPASSSYTPPPSLSVLSPNLTTPYMQQWNLTIEKALGSLGTFSLGYAGSEGTHLMRAFDENQPTPGPGDVQTRRPYPDYGGIFYIDSSANSNYNSLQATFNRQMGSRVSLWVAYTYSHSIDDQSAFLGDIADPNFPQNSHDLAAERGDSSFDMRHRLVLSYVVKMPQGNRWTRNTNVEGITTIQSGQPFTPTLQFDNSNTGNSGGQTGSDRPNELCNPALSNPTANEWFNTSCFAIAPQYTFGDAGRNSIEGPGFASFDMALVRRFSLTERLKMTAQAEGFNLFNRANFNLPQAYADDPSTFGKILSAKAPRQIQLALRMSF